MAPTSAPLVPYFLYASAPSTMPLAAPMRMALSFPVNCRLSGPKPRSEMQPVSARLTAMLAARCFFILASMTMFAPAASPLCLLSPDLLHHVHATFALMSLIGVHYLLDSSPHID